MRNSFIQKLWVEKSVQRYSFTQNIIDRLQVTTTIVDDGETIWRQAQHTVHAEDWQGHVLLARQRGPFLRLCPGTSKHICCLYYNLDVAAGCDLGCSYCILQGYLNSPLLTIYCNLEDLFGELERKLDSPKFFRIGTGELTDSLTFDHITQQSPELVRYFAQKSNAIIELKSKNIHIENILGLDHNRRTVVSWSMNADEVVAREEQHAPSITARLKAAAAVQKAGYRLGFHFDPMIDHPGWQEHYRDIVHRIFSAIRPENIAWISLGALRYPPGMDDLIRERHPESRIVLGELLQGKDKKMRYFKPVRVEMFSSMYEWIRHYSKEVFIYLCMESDDVWKRSFGWSPGNSATLKRLLDSRVMPS
jgi:spore photoproduct lyase